MKSLLRSIALVVLLSGCLGAHAEVVKKPGSEPIHELFSRASVVCTAKVMSLDKVGTRDGEWHGTNAPLELFHVVAAVDRCYKESVLGSLSIFYDRPPEATCTVSRCYFVQKGEYALFFLAKTKAGLEPIDLSSWKFNVSHLKSDLRAVGEGQLRYDLLEGLHDSDESTLLTNLELVGTLGHLQSFSLLLELSGSNISRTISTAAQLALLRLGNYARLKQTLGSAEHPDQEPELLRLQSEVCDVVETVRDPTTVDVLIEFSGSPSDRVRESVIHALREMSDHRAVRTFIHALDDPVQLIRYDAVLGLAATEQRWDLAPSVDVFSSNEPKYISAWKSWWITSGESEVTTRSQ